MKILVTGGAGFIGSHIVDSYIHAGHEVIVFDNLITGSLKNLNNKAKFYNIDINDAQCINLIEQEKPEIINHHAAQIDLRASVNDPLSDIKINVMGLVNLLEAGKNNNLKKVIFASSGGAVYGIQKQFPATESHSTNPISPYGINKLMCEKYLYYYLQQYQIPYISLRYANVYGPRQSIIGEAGVVSIFLKKLLKGEKAIINGDGLQTRDYVFVQDVVASNLLALNQAPAGEYNVGTGQETTVNKLFEILKRLTMSEVDETHGTPIPGEQPRSCISSSKIQQALGWQIKTKLDKGLELTTNWFKNNIEA